MENADSPGVRSSPRDSVGEMRRSRNRVAVAECMDIAKQNISESSVVGQNFETSIRDRNLFVEGENAALARNLLGVDPRDNFEALHELIDGKKILLVGGGRALDDLTSSKKFLPTSVLNVDPYLPHEDIGRSAASYYRSLPLNPTTEHFLQEIQAENYDVFDEIWSTYSLPHYCKTPEEIRTFFRNMYDTLAPGGNLRIFPISFYVERMRMQPLLINGLSKALDELGEKKDIEISVKRTLIEPAAGALNIHRLAATSRSV